MASPFPGMDPYLEDAALWPVFDHQLVTCLYQALLPALVDRFRARVGQRHYATEAASRDTLVVHGENDDRVPLSAVLDWARPQLHPVVVIPGADHFFTGRLPVLRALTVAHLATAIARPD